MSAAARAEGGGAPLYAFCPKAVFGRRETARITVSGNGIESIIPTWDGLTTFAAPRGRRFSSRAVARCSVWRNSVVWYTWGNIALSLVIINRVLYVQR